MTPQLARFALCAFAFLAGAVAVNAFYLQGRTVESPQGSASAAPGQPVRTQIRDDRRLPRFRPTPPSLKPTRAWRRRWPARYDQGDPARAHNARLWPRGGRRRCWPVDTRSDHGVRSQRGPAAHRHCQRTDAEEHPARHLFRGPQARRTVRPGAGGDPGCSELAAVAWLCRGSCERTDVAGDGEGDRAFEANAGLAAKGRITAELVKRLADAAPLKAAAR